MSVERCHVVPRLRLDHTRYLALDCQDQHDSSFFDDCCHPMLSTETLASSRPSYCVPAAASVSAVESDCGVSETATTASATTTTVAAAAPPTTTAPTTTQAPTTQQQDQAQPQTTTKSKTTSTTTTQQAASTGSAPSGSTYTGFATFFYQNGNAGACGNYNSDSTPLVAIDIAWWPNTGEESNLCGRYVNIQNTDNGKTVTAVIADVCPTCDTGNSLDLSTGAFNQIASESDGEVPISWSFA